MNLRVLNIDTPSLGDRSYLVHDGVTAVVVDPQRDIDRVTELLEANNLSLGAVVETHIHNDYVSGGLELSREYGAQYLINSDDSVAYQHRGVKDQEVIPVGTFALKALSTPGHTFTHTSYELIDAESKSIAVFTGGSLLHGTTGRPDLLGWNNAHELAGLQHQSARYLAEMLGDEVNLLPTHGFGSFCSSTPALTDSSTIGDQKRTNPVLLKERDEYIGMTLAGLDVFPTYFNYMAPANTSGPKPVDLSPATKRSADQILTAIKSGAWVVDLRNRVAWADNHLAGSTSIGLDGSMASYLGWLYPYGEELFLISDNPNDVFEAQRELVRIGIDRPTGAFVGAMADFNDKKSVRVASFSELPNAIENAGATLLDVRQLKEREKSFIDPSLHIPFYEVESRVSELPLASEIWVHCASGYRASTVLGFIEKSGRTPVLINEDYSQASLVKGIKVTSA